MEAENFNVSGEGGGARVPEWRGVMRHRRWGLDKPDRRPRDPE